MSGPQFTQLKSTW